MKQKQVEGFTIRQATILFVCLLLQLMPFRYNASAQPIPPRLDTLKKELNNTTSDTAQHRISFQLAQQYRFNNNDSALFYIEKAASLARKLKDDSLIIESDLSKGIILYSLEKNQQAIEIFRHIEPAVIASENQRFLRSLYTGLNDNYVLLNDYPEAIKYAQKGLDIAKKSEDTLGIAHFYFSIGIDFYYAKEFDKAIEYTQKALPLYRSLKNDHFTGLALNNLSNLYSFKADYPQGLEYAKSALQYFKNASNIQPFVYHNFGMAYKGLKDFKKAETYFLKSINMRADTRVTKDKLETQNELAKLYLDWGKLSEGLKLANTSYTEARTNRLFFEQQHLAKTLSELYEMSGNTKQALEFLKNSEDLKDSLETAAKLKTILGLQTKYETLEKENLILQQESSLTQQRLRLKNRNLWISGLIVLAIIIGLIGFLLYNRQWLKNLKQQRENELKLALAKIENQKKLEEQRLAISRDLHDNIGAHLTFIVSSIDTLKHIINSPNIHLNNRLTGMGEFARNTITELRDTIWAMNKQNITTEDIKERITNFVHANGADLPDIRITFEDRNPQGESKTLDSKTGMNIYRIIQEALNNAIKHSNANHIIITQSEKDNRLIFQVQDDGRGFDTTKESMGNGLSNMRKRAADIGSSFDITSEEGRTIITLGV